MVESCSVVLAEAAEQKDDFQGDPGIFESLRREIALLWECAKQVLLWKV